MKMNTENKQQQEERDKPKQWQYSGWKKGFSTNCIKQYDSEWNDRKKKLVGNKSHKNEMGTKQIYT